MDGMIVDEGQEQGGALVRYDKMCRAIDAVYEVDEVKDIRDKAIAFEVYARQARNTEAERRACEIRLRAERKAGALLREREKAKGAAGNPGGRGATIVRSDDPTAQPTLRDLGISKQQSSDWQRLADVPQDQFEAALADTTRRPTTVGIIRGAAERPAASIPPGHVQPFSPAPTRVDDDATWICGRLRDFNRDGLLNKDPAALLATMTVGMLEDIEDFAIPVADWLRGLADALAERGGVP